ncbi:hypothetical protein E2C01_081232 [Portunus trituberculatus]|uniref:Uncharacterized protein n=1 Tax=Portunus trituberculatus TaxID=210409 RepID=A0A5B7IXE4_PORTR|nr:hypothetical protein [Portunus trituberculatus]
MGPKDAIDRVATKGSRLTVMLRHSPSYRSWRLWYTVMLWLLLQLVPKVFKHNNQPDVTTLPDTKGVQETPQHDRPHRTFRSLTEG